MRIHAVRVVPPEERTDPEERIVELRCSREETLKLSDAIGLNQKITLCQLIGLELSRLSFRNGDVIVFKIKDHEDIEYEMDVIRKVHLFIGRYARKMGICLVSVSMHDIDSLESLGEDDMRAVGWVRAGGGYQPLKTGEGQPNPPPRKI